MPEQYVNVKKVHAQIMDAFETALEVIETENAVELPDRPNGRCKFCEDTEHFSDIVCYLPHDNGFDTSIPINFCPNCGADMRGEGNGIQQENS